MNLLAFTPFFDPLSAIVPMDDYWLWLSIPLVLAIAIIYKGTRVRNLSGLPVAVLRLSLEIFGGMAFVAAIVWGLYWVVVRLF